MLIIGCLVGGLWGFSAVGRLEDPGYTLKTALVFTAYPGASAEEVEREVTEVLETAIQRMPQLLWVSSNSTPGLSQITVEIDDTFGPREMPQIWDELRRRIDDARVLLPENAAPPVINDNFGDVYGLYYAVTAEGYGPADLREVARTLRREVLMVPGVAKVEVLGLIDETVTVEVPLARLLALGIPPDQLLAFLASENAVLPAGALRVDDSRMRLDLPAGFDTVEAMEQLRVGVPGTTEQILLSDIARVVRDEAEDQALILRHNGVRGFSLGISVVLTENVVEVGARVEDRLDALRDVLPAGVEVLPIYEQHKVVETAISAFVLSLALSILIVVAALMLTMGLRAGLTVGATLALTVLGTVFFMAAFDIPMERISLGAMIIAMGMLVDNAIVIAEGMVVGMARGRSARDAAVDASRTTAVPLLGATVIGVMAFSGIGLSPDATGELLFPLFAVIGISLLLSWVLALTVTPLLGTWFLQQPVDAGVGAAPHGGRLYLGYAWALRRSLRARWLVVIAIVAITGASLAAFGQVRQAFFPMSSAPIFFVHYTLPRGTDIRATDRDMAVLEAAILDDPDVTAVTGLTGQGATRFLLTYEPELPDPSYGHFIVRARTVDTIPDILDRLGNLSEIVPQGELRFQRIVFGPPVRADVAVRLSGPDPQVLRALGDEALRRMAESGTLTDLRTDWREREVALQPMVDETRARIAGVTRQSIADTLLYASSGLPAGVFRDSDAQIPILVRLPPEERGRDDHLLDQHVWSDLEERYVPMAQIVSLKVAVQEAAIHRRDRARTLTAMAQAGPGFTADTAFRAVRDSIEAMDLPPGYRLEWGGEYEMATEAQTALAAQLPISFLVMLAISVLLFNRVRQPLILWLVVPMSVTGMVLGLLWTGLPFTFLALLGLLSLSGMLIKNAIILVEEIDTRIAAGEEGSAAVVGGSVSRLRPVVLAAGTTILGMLPLVGDAFFASMAVTIMGGLAFASVLTLLAVPVIYALMFGIRAGGSGRVEERAQVAAV